MYVVPFTLTDISFDVQFPSYVKHSDFKNGTVEFASAGIALGKGVSFSQLRIGNAYAKGVYSKTTGGEFPEVSADLLLKLRQ